MNGEWDVIVIGGGRAGAATAASCRDAGLSVCVVDPGTANADATGRGFVVAADKVAVLDPATGDESKLLQAHAIVIATGSAETRPNTGFLGLRKLGVEVDAAGHVVTDDCGRSSVSTVFAVGSCASQPCDAALVAEAILALTAASK